MAQYLILIYEDETAWEATDPETRKRIMSDHTRFAETHGSVLRGGNPLESTATATTLRQDTSGHVTVTDGPFAETKEALGGYYVIEADDLDAALAVAKRVPAPFGGVEVRPVHTMA
jgi:hypothetical protein